MKWFVCECWTLSYSLLRNWLRGHTSWVSSGIGVKIKVFPSNSNLLFLNFTASRYAFMFLNSKNYIIHVIDCEWSRSIFFIFSVAYTHISIKWYQSGLQFQICITCFVSFGIKDNSFMVLEDKAFNFLHGHWNYCSMKIDINVMMFKFDI